MACIINSDTRHTVVHRPGKGHAKGLVWLIEQVPGRTHSADLSDALLQRTYLATYGLPHFKVSKRPVFQNAYRVGCLFKFFFIEQGYRTKGLMLMLDTHTIYYKCNSITCFLRILSHGNKSVLKYYNMG